MKSDSHFYTVDTFQGTEHDALGVLQIIPPRASKIKELSVNGNEFSRKIPFDGLLTNKLLTALPGQDLARLLAYLEPISLEAGRNVYELGEEVKFVYFPETAIVSNFHSLEDGTTTEAAVIGNDGMVGMSAILDPRAPS
jgi:hypothetical protein